MLSLNMQCDAWISELNNDKIIMSSDFKESKISKIKERSSQVAAIIKEKIKIADCYVFSLHYSDED